MDKKLYIPGPIYVAPDTLQAMTRPMIGHRMPEYATLHESVIGKLRQMLHTEGYVFLSTSSAFGIMEGAARNLVQKKCACFANGAFSNKWHNVIERCGLKADKISIAWGSPVTAELVEKTLASGEYDAMTMVHNETSTGVLSPLAEIAEVMKKFPEVSFIVDTVSSMSAVDIDVETLGMDCCIAGVQKAFGLPPGLAVFTASKRAIEKAKRAEGRGYYFDFEEFAKNAEKHNTPSTPCISTIYALDYQLDKFIAEGWENRYARHAEMADATRAWAKKMGFDLFAAEGARSNTLTCIKNDDKTDLAQLKKLAGERGYAIDNGYGKIKNETFRIAHMGDFTMQDMEEIFALLEELLPQVRN